MFGLSISKYRDLIIAIALFLVLDLGVLLFSFYVSSQIRGDASRINASSEIRMLTQQATKSLLTLKDETVNGLPNQTSIAQLSGLLPIFSGNIAKLKAEFEQSLGDPVQKLLLGNRMADNAAQLTKVSKTWTPLEEALTPVVARADPPLEIVDYATTKAVAVNIKLMLETDDLTSMLEDTAARRATSLQQIQIVGILLAMLNFIFIIFKFLRTLSTGDQKIMTAKHEIDNILTSIQEGLLLVRRDGSISGQHSASLAAILGTPIKPGTHINELLKACLRNKEYEIATEYVDLLLSGKVKASMVKQLNPLLAVRLSVGEQRYATFDFTPVVPLVGAKDVSSQDALLVAVFDVTEKVALEQAVANAKEQAKAEGEILSQILNSEAGAVTEFLRAAQQDLDEVNTALRDVKGNVSGYRTLVGMIFRVIHNIKGQSAMLGLSSIEIEAHRFEDTLVELQRRNSFTGDALIPVSLAMSDLMSRMVNVSQIVDKLSQFGSLGAARSGKEDGAGLAEQPDPIALATRYLSELAQRIAFDEKKEVALNTQFQLPTVLPPKIMKIARDVLPQLVRNAVVHGIEHPDERERLGKPRQGSITLSVSSDSDQDISIHVHDDGRGLSFDAIRNTLSTTGRMSREQIASLTEQQLIAQIFEPGVSTAHVTGLHAGRGVGLDLVKDVVDKAGGRIRVRSRLNGHTEFFLKFPRALFV